MRRARFVPFVILLAAAAVLVLVERERPAGGGDWARVTRVVDGDTVEVSLHGELEKVRYIGIDTPESVKPGTPVQCFAEAAAAENRRLVEGRRVSLRYDAERRDRYGRLLAYVYLPHGGPFVNAALLRLGYARTLTIPPNVAHAGLFYQLATAARQQHRGLWRAC